MQKLLYKHQTPHRHVSNYAVQMMDEIAVRSLLVVQGLKEVFLTLFL